MEVEKLEEKLREALRLVDYLEFETKEQQSELNQLAWELSKRIKNQFGEVPIWFLTNRILWAIDKAKVKLPITTP